MKKLTLCMFCLGLFFSLTAVPVYAFGGFVAKEGSNTYHDIYCELTEGCQLSELIWFDTAEQACAAGLVSCPACDSANGFEFEYDLDTNWKTDDHLLQSAMEIESEIAYYKGYKDGREECCEEGETAGFDVGYETGLGEGYDIGYDAGYEEARIKYERESEEESSGIKEILFVAGACVTITFFAHLLDRRKAKT